MSNIRETNSNTYGLLKVLRLFAIDDADVIAPFVGTRPDFSKYATCCNVDKLEAEYEEELQDLLRQELGVATQEELKAKVVGLFDLVSAVAIYKSSDAVENLAAIYNKRMEMDTDDIRDCEEMLDLTEFEED